MPDPTTPDPIMPDALPALDGVRVLESSTWGFGPIGGMMLGDLGADVIKIESPTRPDAARFVASVAGIPNLMPDGHSALFEAVNRNKRSLALDLKTERGREIFRALITDTDVFIENYRPGALERLGLGYESLAEINPGLIHAATAGYGFKGAEAHLPALDAVGQARAGFMYSMGAPGDPPNWNTLGVADVMGATCLAYGILAALAARERNGGRGQRVEVSHIMATMWLSYWGVSVAMLTGLNEWPRFDRSAAANPLWNLYQCGDGEWLILGILEAERDWAAFCRAAGLERLTDDPRFTTLAAMGEHCGELIAILEERFASAPRAEWERRLAQEPNLIFTRVQKIGDLPSDPAVIANGYLAEHEHRRYGPTPTLRHPADLLATPAEIRRDAPELGEHSAELLAERLGFSEEQIAALAAAGVIG